MRATSRSTTRPGLVWALLALVLGAPGLGGPAWAQAQPEDPPAADPAAAAPPAADPLAPPIQAPPVPWSRDHRWRPTGMDEPVVSVGLTPLGTRLAMNADGAVLRASAGGPWRVALPADGASQVETSIDEDVLLETEATIDELVVTTEPDESSTDEEYDAEEETVDVSDEDIDLAEDAGQEAADTVGEIDQVVLDVAERLEAGAAAEAPGVGGLFASTSQPGLVLAGRADGLWASVDDGRTWARVSPALAVTAVLDLGADRLLAGGAEGLGQSHDAGEHWRRVRGALDERRVFSLARVGEALLAGTDGGLFFSVDGERWTRAGGAGSEDLVVWDLLADPGWDGGLWLATSAGLLRSDDLGQTLRPASRNPLLGVRDLALTGQPGQILLSGTEGAWESVDGGLTWQPLPLGLPGPENTALASGGGTVLIAGADGVYELGRTPGTEPDRSPDLRAGQAGARRLPEVVGRALERPGLDLDLITVNGKLVALQMMPRLIVVGEHRVSRYRDTLYDSLRTSEYRVPETTIETALCWGACVYLDATTDYDDGYSSTTEYDYDAVDDALTEDLAVIDGEVYDLSDVGAISSAAANVAQRATTYRTDVARIVSEAFLSRQRLLAEAPAMSTLPLREQVAHSLLIDELAARLDVYTDGWFTRNQADPTSLQSSSMQ